jgi:hypothetical protein
VEGLVARCRENRTVLMPSGNAPAYILGWSVVGPFTTMMPRFRESGRIAAP